METLDTVVQKILVQDIEKLLDSNNQYNNSYVIDRCKSLDDLKCIYDMLEMPSDYYIVVTVRSARTGSGYINQFWSNKRETDMRYISYGTVVHAKQFDAASNYKNLKHLQLLVKNSPVPSYKNSQDHYHDGIVGVILDDKLKISFPHVYTKPYYPISLIKDDVFKIKAFGTAFELTKIAEMYSNLRGDEGMNETDFKIYKMVYLWNSIKNAFHVEDAPREALNEIFKFFSGLSELPFTQTEGITKTLTPLQNFYNNCVAKDFISALAVKALVDSSKSTVGGIKYSTVFNKLFANIVSQEEFNKKAFELSEVYLANFSSLHYSKNSFLTAVLDTLAEAREMKKAVLKRKSTGAFNKIMDDLEFIEIDKDKYPLSYAAVTAGEIPTSTFFRKTGESYFIYNDNWDIWEDVLKEHKEIAISIAAEASRRTTYEKDIMSYFYFTMHVLPEYLEKHTGKKWKGIPKLVSSADELEPPTEGSNGVAKTRSALTPIVDNEKSEVVVPYVSMQIGGYQTTYCYGLNYSVLQKGFSFNGNVVTKDVEEQLNGRDNYGLMFYTLTGTAQGRGYPTFLIIFENMNKEKYGQNFRVHFHRTHPMRSKSGDYNPVHNWTKGCYKWMIGNVNYERIVAQQGDLAFVQIEKMPEGEITEVNAYDNHCFDKPVKFTPYLKKEKQNILGYVDLVEDTVLNHNEHLNRTIPKGIYEIRQCRSWEANPKGIWSLRID